MKDLLCDEFQAAVDECLLRHRSILDVLSKLHEAEARVGRAVLKAVTSCGCVAIEARRPEIPPDASLQDLKQYMKTHLIGEICEHCREVLEDEIGKLLFYLAALCNHLDLNVYDILIKEHRKLQALGRLAFA